VEAQVRPDKGRTALFAGQRQAAEARSEGQFFLEGADGDCGSEDFLCGAMGLDHAKLGSFQHGSRPPCSGQ
jgi:hypothetical protein